MARFLILQNTERRSHGLELRLRGGVAPVAGVWRRRPWSEIWRGRGQVVRLAGGGKVDGWLAAPMVGDPAGSRPGGAARFRRPGRRLAGV